MDEDQNIMLEDFHIYLTRIRSKIQVIIASLKDLQFFNSWPELLMQYSSLSKQYATLTEEFSSLIDEFRLVYPGSLQGIAHPQIISEILRTRMEPEFEEEEHRLSEEWKNQCDESVMISISISETEEQVDAHDRMCMNILDIFSNRLDLIKRQRLDLQPLKLLDTHPTLRNLFQSMEKGIGLELPKLVEPFVNKLSPMEAANLTSTTSENDNQNLFSTGPTSNGHVRSANNQPNQPESLNVNQSFNITSQMQKGYNQAMPMMRISPSITPMQNCQTENISNMSANSCMNPLPSLSRSFPALPPQTPSLSYQQQMYQMKQLQQLQQQHKQSSQNEQLQQQQLQQQLQHNWQQQQHNWQQQQLLQQQQQQQLQQQQQQQLQQQQQPMHQQLMQQQQQSQQQQHQQQQHQQQQQQQQQHQQQQQQQQQQHQQQQQQQQQQHQQLLLQKQKK